MSAPSIAAHARHTILLAPGESIAECLCGGGSGSGEPGASEELVFEVRGWGAAGLVWVCALEPGGG